MLYFSPFNYGNNLRAVRVKTLKMMIGASAMVFTGSALAVPFSYSVINLGTGGMANTRGISVNDLGHVVGSGTDARSRRAFTYVDGTYSVLENFGGADLGNDINSAGQVTGSASDPSQGRGRQAFLYSNGTTTNLGTFGGATSVGTAINEHGHVAGYADLAQRFVTHAFLYKDGAMQDLGTLGGNTSRAYGINSHGAVVGFSSMADGSWHSFVYANGGMRALSMFDGLESWAQGINDDGVIVGYAFTEDGERAYRHVDGVAYDLGTLGGRSTGAFALNNSGTIVGYSTLESGEGAGFIWENGKMYDLNNLIGRDLGWTITEAFDINARGQVLVQACHAVNGCNSLLLTPNEVPEPPVLAAFLAGLLAMFGGVTLRRKH